MIKKIKQLKFYLFLLFLFLQFASFGQVEVQKRIDDVVMLKKEVSSIPVPPNDKKFIDFLNYKFDQFTKKKADTVLLLYIETTGYGIRNYGLIFTKTGTSSQTYAFDKSSKTNYKIESFSLENDTLKSINTYALYQFFQNDFVRSRDTNIITSHDDIVYCKFYFEKVNKIYTGFYDRFFNLSDILDRNFRRAYINESIRH